MNTRILLAREGRASREDLADLARLLEAGGLVVFPTETVYGIAAARGLDSAIDRLADLKGRPRARPLTIHVADPSDVTDLAAPLAPAAQRLSRRLWPGPLTLVVPDPEGRPTGFRVPDDAIARRLFRASAEIVVATSANRTGEPPCMDGASAVREFDGRVAGIIAAGECRYQAPSTVVAVSQAGLSLLREGAISFERVRRAACHRVLLVCTGNLCRSPMAEGILAAQVAGALGVRVPDLISRGVHVLSAGTAGIVSEPATENAVLAAAEHDAVIDGHLSRPLTPTLIEGADEIYVATDRHAEAVRRYVPEAAGKTWKILRDGRDLADPIGQSLDVYREVASRIAEAMRPVAERLARMAVAGS